MVFLATRELIDAVIDISTSLVSSTKGFIGSSGRGGLSLANHSRQYGQLRRREYVFG